MAKGKGNRVFVWIIMGLLFVGLLGFGTGGFSGNIRSLGTVGDKDGSVVSYQNNLREQIRAFEAQVGSRVTFQQAQSLGLDQAVLSQLVSLRAIDNEVSDLGLSIGDERVREEVLAIPAFRGLDGNFDREAYGNTLRRNGQSEGEFEVTIREEIARTLLQGAVVGGIEPQETYANAIVDYVSEGRSIDFAPVTAEDLQEPVPGPTEADLSDFHDANPELFTKPETRELTYAWLTPSMIQDELEVDTATVRALYDERSAEFIRPERRLVERLVFVDETTAQTAADRLTSGEIDFDGLVAERGLDLSDIDLGDVSQTELGAAGDVVFAAEPGDVVGPANSSIGPALFRMNAILAADETTFEEAEPELRAELSADRARRVIEAASEGMTDLLAGGATVEDLAEQTELELGTISWDETTESGIAAYEEFRIAAATAEEGGFPELANLSDGSVFVLRLDRITEPTVRPLDEVRDTARDAWIADRRHEMVQEQAQTLANQIQPLTGFDSLGLTAERQDGLTRRSFVEGTPPAFMTEVFEMAVGDVRVIDNGMGNGALIVRLNGIAPPQTDDPQVEAERSSAGNTAAAGIAQDIFDAFATEIQSETEIRIDQSVLNALHTQFQ